MHALLYTNGVAGQLKSSSILWENYEPDTGDCSFDVSDTLKVNTVEYKCVSGLSDEIARHI